MVEWSGLDVIESGTDVEDILRICYFMFGIKLSVLQIIQSTAKPFNPLGLSSSIRGFE